MERNKMKRAKHLIKHVVYLHGVFVKNQTGLDVDANQEEDRLYNEFIGGQITIQDIRDDIAEYVFELRK